MRSLGGQVLGVAGLLLVIGLVAAAAAIGWKKGQGTSLFGG